MNRALLAALILILGGSTACATSNAATQFGSGSVTLRIGDQQQ